MKIEFNIEPYKACMAIKASYIKNEISQGYFYLNRDFKINRCIVDNVDFKLNVELIALETFDGYKVNKYNLPQSFKQIEIEYIAYLTGETGSCPYVREIISPEFTLIRFESFCYPMFCKDDIHSLIDFINGPADIDLTVIVPNEFVVASDATEIKKISTNGITTFGFKSEAFGFNLAVAKYIIKELSVGKFYLLGEIDSNQVESIMIAAHEFMNTHFGMRKITGINYIAIPDHLGGFAKPKALFVDETTFKSIKSMNHIIHEFIHLGWNVPANNETQRIRFFDEAFASYFEMRVMEHILNDNYRLNEFINAYKNQLTRYDNNISVIDFGKHEYGELSYTIGAIILYKLSEFVGITVFEEATKTFLEKYRNTPVDIETFCNEYIKLCNKPELKQFFEDWIYTTHGTKSFIESSE